MTIDNELQCPNCEAKCFVVVKSDEEIRDREGNFFLIRDFERTRCQNCGFAFVTPKQAKRHHRVMEDAKREQAGLLKSDEVRRIREALRLRQEDAARIFGGGQNAFSKYECGYVTQSAAMDKLLRVASRFP